MSIIGAIEQGTVVTVLNSVQHAEADALVLFERDDEVGHVVFERGEIVSAFPEDLPIEQTIGLISEWEHGYYAVIKGNRERGPGSVPVVVTGVTDEVGASVEQWLQGCGFASVPLPLPRQLLHVVKYVQAAAVVMSCPDWSLGVSCAELEEASDEHCGVVPVFAILEVAETPCEARHAGCLRCPPTEDGLCALLEEHLPRRSQAPPGAQEASAQEASAQEASAQEASAQEEASIGATPSQEVPAAFPPESAASDCPEEPGSGESSPARSVPLLSPVSEGDSGSDAVIVDRMLLAGSARPRRLVMGLAVAALGLALLVVLLLVWFPAEETSTDGTGPEVATAQTSQAPPQRRSAPGKPHRLAVAAEPQHAPPPDGLVQLEVATRPAGMELVDSTTGESLGKGPLLLQLPLGRIPFSVQARHGSRVSPPVVVLARATPGTRHKPVLLELTAWLASIGAASPGSAQAASGNPNGQLP